LIVADLTLAVAPGVAVVTLGAALWGLHMGLTQGILASLVADTAPPDLRGTAFGMYNLVSGIATLAASVIAGVLWDALGAQVTFGAGAIFTALALAVVPLVRRSLDAPR
jgi:MFS family permease